MVPPSAPSETARGTPLSIAALAAASSLSQDGGGDPALAIGTSAPPRPPRAPCADRWWPPRRSPWRSGASPALRGSPHRRPPRGSSASLAFLQLQVDLLQAFEVGAEPLGLLANASQVAFPFGQLLAHAQELELKPGDLVAGRDDGRDRVPAHPDTRRP